MTAKIEPFDSFWEGPEDVEKGYGMFFKFYKHNYLKHLPANKDANILAVSCGAGYLVNMLTSEGYTSVLGIDSDPAKVDIARKKGLNCITEEAFPFLERHTDEFDVIFFECEINHLTKDEILELLDVTMNSLRKGGIIVIHTMNGANPIVGSEGFALNFDHYNTFTEQSMRQILKFKGYQDINVIPLKLFVFYENPLNYVGIALDKTISLAFRGAFIFYGKSNKLFTKKIAAIARKG
jgi:SAM-dependent methyltransferase